MAPTGLAHVVSRVAVVMACLVAMLIPSAYFLAAYPREVEYLQQRTELAADAVSQVIARHPTLWRYQEHRLYEALNGSRLRGQSLVLRFEDLDGKVLSVADATLKFPTIRARAWVRDGHDPVGEIAAQASVWPLLFKTVIAAVTGMVVGILVFVSVRLLPFRALLQAGASLEASQQALQSEIASKEHALRQAEELGQAMRHLALHDPLTGLPNRTLLQDRLTQTLLQARRNEQSVVLLTVDLSGFKDINDSLGHQAGDQILREVAYRLSETLRASDTLARVGSDEFSIVSTIADDEGAHVLATRVLESLAEPLPIAEQVLSLRAAVGIAIGPAHGDTSDLLLRCAEVALHNAKQTHQAVSVYRAGLETGSQSRLRLMNELPHSLRKGELFLLYQPKVDLRSGNAYGVEALIRWQHSELGLIPPTEFIALAEQSGKIGLLTQWVLETVVKQMEIWRREDIDVSVSVNLSAHDLHDDSLPGRVMRLLKEHGIVGERLILEITESAMMQDPASAMQVMSRLHDLGVRVSVDDFGTGYSSLAYLHKLAIDELKIDKSFILRLDQQHDDAIIVRSVIDLAHNLGLSVVAEGVENRETYHMLAGFGCDSAQGYYLSKPMVSTRLREWLDDRAGRPAGSAHRARG